MTNTLGKADVVVATLLQRNGQAISFDWTPANTIESSSDYTLEILQGTDSSETPDFTISAATMSSAKAATNASGTAT